MTYILQVFILKIPLPWLKNAAITVQYNHFQKVILRIYGQQPTSKRALCFRTLFQIPARTTGDISFRMVWQPLLLVFARAYIFLLQHPDFLMLRWFFPSLIHPIKISKLTLRPRFESILACTIYKPSIVQEMMPARWYFGRSWSWLRCKWSEYRNEKGSSKVPFMLMTLNFNEYRELYIK